MADPKPLQRLLPDVRQEYAHMDCLFTWALIQLAVAEDSHITHQGVCGAFLSEARHTAIFGAGAVVVAPAQPAALNANPTVEAQRAFERGLTAFKEYRIVVAMLTCQVNASVSSAFWGHLQPPAN